MSVAIDITHIGEPSIEVDTIKLQVTKRIPLNEWKKATDPNDCIEFNVSVPGGSQRLLKFQFYPKDAFVYADAMEPESPRKLAISWAGRFDQEGGRRGPVKLEEQGSYDLRVEKRQVDGCGVGGSIREHAIGSMLVFRAEVQLFYSADQRHLYFEEDSEKRSLMDNLSYKFGSKDSDFSVVCEGKEIRRHKLILASQSEYFKTLFTQTDMKTLPKEGMTMFNENRSNDVRIEDIEFDTMRLLLSYLYCQSLPESLSREQVSELLVAADRLQVIIVIMLII